MIVRNLERLNSIMGQSALGDFWEDVTLDNKMLFSCVERSFYNRVLISERAVSDMILIRRACEHIINTELLSEYGDSESEGLRIFCNLFKISCSENKLKSKDFDTRAFDEISFVVDDDVLDKALTEIKQISHNDISNNKGIDAFNITFDALKSAGVARDAHSFGWLLNNFDFGIDSRYIESERRVLISLFKNKIAKQLRNYHVKKRNLFAQ